MIRFYVLGVYRNKQGHINWQQAKKETAKIIIVTINQYNDQKNKSHAYNVARGG